MSEYVLETSGLSKIYGGKKVLDNVDLKVKKGDIYGFIGPNGAGKTTVIRIVAGMIKQSEGILSLFDSNNLSAGRKKMGVVVENPAYYPYMSASDNLKVHALAKGISDELVISELLEKVGLENAGNKKLKDFSLGMKQRLGIALALMGDPEFLVLDEPINGLDPMGIKELRDLILKLNKDCGITIFISSHILGELLKICTAYGVISEGKLVDQFTSEELSQRVCSFIKIETDDAEKMAEVLMTELEISNVEVGDGFIKIYEKTDDMMRINSVIVENGISFSSISKDDGNYENYFIGLMKGENKDA